MAEDGEVNEAVLFMWTVYAAPPRFVARQFVICRGDPTPRETGQSAVAPSLEVMRRMLPPGLFPVPRSEGDDPAIVETWM